MACAICDGKEKKNIIYENDKIIIMLAENPCISGHLQMFPKRHITIMEQLTNDEADYMIDAANKVSMVLFEALKFHGTNILVENGIPAGQTTPHFSMHIIPRRSDDGLKLDWDMKQASSDSLDSIQRIISEGMEYDVLPDIPMAEEKPAPQDHIRDSASDSVAFDNPEGPSEDEPIEAPAAPMPDNNDDKPKKVNYWLKSLERIP